MDLEPNELMTLVKSFMNKIDEQNKKIESLEKSIYEDFLGPAEQNFKDWDHTTRLNDFKDKYKDTFTEELCNSCKKAEGDEEFDLPAKIFDDYEATDKSMEEEEYVTSIVASLKEQLDSLREALNTDTVEVVQDATGDTEVVADGDKVAEVTEVDVSNEGESEEKPEEKPEEESEEDLHNKELEDFIKELEDEKVDHKNYY